MMASIVKARAIRLGPHVPTEVPLDLVPVDLQPMRSRFWMVFNERREVVGVERVESAG